MSAEPAGWHLEIEQPFASHTTEADAAQAEHSTVRRWRFGNGLAVIVLVDRAAPLFSYQTWFRVGSRHEQQGLTGMAHLFEHLMFNQTEHLPPGELDRLVERTGGETNAATWVDWTYYRDSLPARDLELAVRLESERMQHLVLEAGPLESEREVVVNEREERVENDVDGFLDEELFRLAFTAHPYHWPTIGWMEDIRRIGQEDIRRFYRTYYSPNNATIVVVGDVDEARLLGLIASYYGAIAPASLPTETALIEPEQEEERRVRFAKPVPSDRAVLGYKIPGQGHPDWAALELASTLLAGGPSARLYRRLVVETEIASSIDVGVMPFRDPSLLRIGVSLARGRRAEEAIAEIDLALATLAREPVSAAELAKVKNVVETDFWSGLIDCDGKAEALGHYESTLGDFRRLFDMAERLEAVGADDLQRVAASYLVPSRRTVVIAEPDGDAEDEEEDDDDEVATGDADGDPAIPGAGL
jgi:zinc protease